MSIYVPTLPSYGRLSIPSEERFGSITISPLTTAYMEALGISSAQAFGALILSGGIVIPTIPDGVYPMGFQGLVRGQPAALRDLGRDWNFNTDGLDLSGWRIHGKVGCAPNSTGINNIIGDGFEIVGSDNGSSGNLLDCNGHFSGTIPHLQHFTIKPNVPVISVNGFMGDEAWLYDFDISQVGGDALSPNNMHNGYRALGLTCDWGFCHDQVYYYPDSSHSNGTHNDGGQIPGGTGGTFTRIYFTGITCPTFGQDVALRTNGSGAGQGVLPLGQQNSAIQFTQDVSHVGDILFDMCRFGGGWTASVNCYNTSSETMGPITFSNSLWDGNNLRGNDIIYNPAKTTLVLSGNRLVGGGAIHVNSNGG